LGQRKINFSVVIAGQLVGIREVADQVWQVSLLEYDPGYFDQEQDRVSPNEGNQPFGPGSVDFKFFPIPLSQVLVKWRDMYKHEHQHHQQW